MSGSIYPTLSLTIPLFNVLVDHVEDTITSIEESNNENDEEGNIFINISNQNKNIIKSAAEFCKVKLLTYYNKTNNTYLMSTILDPRLKLDYYKEHEWNDPDEDVDMIEEIKQTLVYFFNLF